VSPPAVLPLVRLAAFQSVVCARLVGVYWFPTPAVPSAFPSKLAVSTVRRPLLTCVNRFILSYALLPFRVLPFRARPTPPGVKHLPWGRLFPLRDFSPRRPLRNGDSTLRHLSVFGVSHALDGFRRRWPCGFVSPHCHVQGSPFRGLILPHSRPQLVAEVVPSRRLTELRCPQLPTSSTSLGPVLRAFPLCGNPKSLLRCLAAASIRSPPGLASSRSSLSMPWERLHAP